ncbi:MAG: hypothetical protein DME02_01865 [Candidatus Rokuibacteriota bacterium]|nr:MAG: hypothetical protein DME02_01865 [Candidatus Rokubacteria bacterium]PYO25269.1 MAG: hypothetical protein DMD85_04315 [Candidatus Rokubacteria bacterium]
MKVPNVLRWAGFAAATALLLLVAGAAPARADLRISDLDIYLNDHEVTVRVVLLDAIPPGFHEGFQSGIPTHVKFKIELWQYNRLWRDRLVRRVTIERQLAYNAVTKEYKVSSLRGETLPAYGTRDLRDAQRVFSEVRALKLGAAGTLNPAEIFYIRVLAEAALNGENTFVTRMEGTAEQTVRQSEYRTIQRMQ